MYMPKVRSHVDPAILEALRVVRTACEDTSTSCADCPFRGTASWKEDGSDHYSCMLNIPASWKIDLEDD